jgi:hypothetical protein
MENPHWAAAGQRSSTTEKQRLFHKTHQAETNSFTLELLIKFRSEQRTPQTGNSRKLCKIIPISSFLKGKDDDRSSLGTLLPARVSPTPAPWIDMTIPLRRNQLVPIRKWHLLAPGGFLACFQSSK